MIKKKTKTEIAQVMAELDVMFANWKCVPTITSKNFLEKAKKEKEELAECYEEAKTAN